MATLLKTLRPSRLIPGVTIAWGATVLGSGFLRTYGQLLATRLILGACEAALSPCMFLWLTVWYKRNEIATRQCYLFISAAISGVVGGLIAAGLLKMDGLHGLRGWQVSWSDPSSVAPPTNFVCLNVVHFCPLSDAALTVD
jgi:MFS family permease